MLTKSEEQSATEFAAIQPITPTAPLCRHPTRATRAHSRSPPSARTRAGLGERPT